MRIRLNFILFTGMAWLIAGGAWPAITYGNSVQCLDEKLRPLETPNFPAFLGNKVDPEGEHIRFSEKKVNFGALPEGAEVYALGGGRHGSAYRIQYPNGSTRILKVCNMPKIKDHDFTLYRELAKMLPPTAGPLPRDQFRIVRAHSVDEDTMELEDVHGQTVYDLVDPKGKANTYLSAEEKQSLTDRFNAAWRNLYHAVASAHRMGSFTENRYLGFAPYTLKYMTEDGEGLTVKLIMSNVVLDRKTGDLVIIDPS